ncbi:glycoside hydrolase superfamily [Armillaria fumosa]|nr:glycoside hydrolase superfamily [Armillaria fumosa]
MILLVSFILVSIGSALSQTTVSVSSVASHQIPTTLCALIMKDISSGDGGLYAELLQNRAFQQVTAGTSAALKAWYSVNGALTVVAETEPVSSALPNALNVTIASDATGPVGFGNTGYFGMKFTAGNTYNASFYYRFPESANFIGELDVSLQTSEGIVLASASVSVSGDQTSWKQVFVSLTSDITPDAADNVFVVTADGAAASRLTINFAMFSLFPPTFNNRSNGMRIDIAETLQTMKPSFFRFPGGNNLVCRGQNTASRWVWNATLGHLVDRPGRLGDWGYINTDGLGLLEYLLWCEDLEIEPIMAVWAGYGLGGQSIAEDDLEPYIQSAIDQAPARRAELGHPEPFKLTYVEIGNEVRPSLCLYGYRWNLYVTTLQNEFPNLHFIATTFPFNPNLDPTPTEYDVHVYQSSTWMSENSFYYDDFQRNGTKYFEGEYATTENDQGSTFQYSTVEAATADAVFMTGFERNADIVFAASYAPLLQQIGYAFHFVPYLLQSDAGAVYPSVSYYVQQLFGVYRGDEYIPSTLPARNGTMFWSVVRKTSVINRNDNATDVTFQLPFNVSNTATVTVLTGAKTSANTPSDPDLVLPQTSSISTGSTFDYSAPAFSVNVMVLNIE